MSTKRILVIDDEPDIRELAQMSLEMVSGWQVLTAESGNEGIAKAKQEKPDAILLDAMMPEYGRPRDIPETAGRPIDQANPRDHVHSKSASSRQKAICGPGRKRRHRETIRST